MLIQALVLKVAVPAHGSAPFPANDTYRAGVSSAWRQVVA
jgi:hypothetical protein